MVKPYNDNQILDNFHLTDKAIAVGREITTYVWLVPAAFFFHSVGRNHSNPF